MTLAAIVFGVTGLILVGGFVQDIFVQLGEAIIHSQTGHVQIFRKDFLDKGSRSPERYLIDEPEKLTKQLAENPEVDITLARLFFSGLLNNGKRDLAIVGEGVEPDKEARLGSFIQIVAGRQLKDQDRDGILVGAGVAKSLGLKPGDRVTLVMTAAEGAMNTLDFEVIGVFQSFSKDFDARALRIPLKSAQELMQTKGVNLIVLAAHETAQTSAIVEKLPAQLKASGLEFKEWRQISDFYDKAVKLYESQFGVLQYIILLMVLLSVANSVNMSVFERQGEFGTMQAVGNRARDIMGLICIESVFIGAFGALLGVLLGVSLAWIISAIGIPMPPPPNANIGYTAYIRLTPSVIITAMLVGFGATVMAALFPSYKVTRIAIVDSLRQNI